MRLRFPFYLGLRNFFARNRKLSPHMRVSVLGIGLSLIPLIVVLEVADGMIEGITRRYLELGTYHLQITLPIDDIMTYQRVSKRLREADPVRLTLVEKQGIGLLNSENARTGVTIRAVPPTLYREDESFRKYFSLSSGSFNLEVPDSILLGKEVASKLGAAVGSRVKLLTLAGRRSVPKVTSFQVTGIFSSGYQELDRLWVYIPLKTGLRILNARNSSQFIGVKLNNPFDRLDKQIMLLEEYLPPSASVFSWYQLEKANYKSFQTTKALLIFIMALIVIVAAFNISSALIMVVLEKTQEIGILKGMGAHPNDISLAYLVTGLITGFTGTILGLFLGLMIAVNINEIIGGLEYLVNLAADDLRAIIYPFSWRSTSEPIKIFNTAFYLEEIPIRLRMQDLFGVSALTLLLSALAAYLPARSAGRIKPVEVLRKY